MPLPAEKPYTYADILTWDENERIKKEVKRVFGRKKNRRQPAFDTAGKIPVIRSSICTGERVAGFKEEASGRFTEVMLIRDAGDLEEFLRLYGVTEEELHQEW